MEEEQDIETIQLPARAIWTTTSARVIRCRSGQVWLTDVDAIDRILQPGDERAVFGQVVIEALEPTELLVASRRRQPSERGGLLRRAFGVLELSFSWIRTPPLRDTRPTRGGTPR